MTSLEQYDVEDVFEEFAVAANDDGVLDRDAFEGCFEVLIDRAGGHDDVNVDPDRLQVILDRMFDLFDTDGNGVVDFSELASGLSVLCGGSRDDKAKAAFSLFDYNGDGYISLEEMTRYLASVFKVMYETQPGTAEQMGVSAEDLATVTAEQAFEDADLNHDGRLSFEEFQKWYGQANNESNSGKVVEAASNFLTLTEYRNISGLEYHNAEDVFNLFAANATDGKIGLQDFKECMLTYSNGSDERFSQMCDNLFALFDTDGNGYVDFNELASGLSILCGGTSHDKVRAAFNLYDINKDGFISLEEMVTYLSSIFKVMYASNEKLEKSIGASAEDLAIVTAKEAFETADLNHDGRLSFSEFKRWYSDGWMGNGSTSADNNATSNGGAQDFDEIEEQKEVKDTFNLSYVRRITKLSAYDANEVYEIFSEMSPSGSLDEEKFVKCFNRIIKLGGGHSNDTDKQNADSVIRKLFKAFDSNSNGIVDSGSWRVA